MKVGCTSAWLLYFAAALPTTLKVIEQRSLSKLSDHLLTQITLLLMCVSCLPSLTQGLPGVTIILGLRLAYARRGVDRAAS